MATHEIVSNYQYPRAAEVAKAFGVTTDTVWDWAQRGLIPRYKIGHSTFFRWEDINLVLARNRYLGGCRAPVPKL